MLTENEKKVLRMLLASLGEEHSINQIARECGLAPNGAFKILRKFEKEEILSAKKISNIKSYRINFLNNKTLLTLELSLISELKGRIKFRFEDLKSLKDISEIAAIFGSYTNLEKEPNDLDMLFVIKKKDFNKYKSKLKEISPLIPVKIHDVLQTEEDLRKNLFKDKIIKEILKKGIFLWGHKKLIELIKDETR